MSRVGEVLSWPGLGSGEFASQITSDRERPSGAVLGGRIIAYHLTVQQRGIARGALYSWRLHLFLIGTTRWVMENYLSSKLNFQSNLKLHAIVFHVVVVL